MSEPHLRLAIVVQRYGVEVSGGAELHARWIAEHLLPYADIDVLTTRALDYLSWADHFPAGETVVNGVTVRRFGVDHERRIDQLISSSNTVFTSGHSLLDEYDWINVQGPISSGLLKYIAANRDAYDIFIFFTYEYASTFFGLQIVPEKSILIPEAHDNEVLRLPLFRNTFHLPRYIAYNTEAGRDFVSRITRNHHIPSMIVGAGINTPSDIDASRFRAKYDLDGAFLFYVGRVDPAKNLVELIEFYRRYYDESDAPAQLVFAGSSVMDIPSHPGVITLGRISEQDKFDGLAACSVMVLPSLQESLSMIVLEAWLSGSPVMVHGDCGVTKRQVQLSNGGVYYHDYHEFVAGLNLLLSSPALCEQMGRQGRQFTRENYDWDIIVKKYLLMFNQVLASQHI